MVIKEEAFVFTRCENGQPTLKEYICQLSVSSLLVVGKSVKKKLLWNLKFEHLEGSQISGEFVRSAFKIYIDLSV